MPSVRPPPLRWTQVEDDMDQSKLNKILAAHREWIKSNGEQGICANLTGADLTDADLTDAILPNGKTLSEYSEWLTEGLLTQGGKSLSEVVAAWDRHTWEGCPMHVAFNASGLAAVPECWRAEAATFVALFDGGHLPEPEARS
jgi:hypothetical protein